MAIARWQACKNTRDMTLIFWAVVAVDSSLNQIGASSAISALGAREKVPVPKSHVSP